MDEVPLSGGSVAKVVRIGNTVRRSRDRWSAAVHGVLTHLERVGFEGIPRFLGVDAEGREILSWIEGTPSIRPWPEPLLHDEGLRSVVSLVRRCHDALSSYRPPPDAEWFTGAAPVGAGQIVCHGDLGPWNIVWRDDDPVGLIDWDFTAPASPLVDLAWLAFSVVPMQSDEHCLGCGFDEIPDRRQRLTILCDTYGSYSPGEVVKQAEVNWRHDIDLIVERGPTGQTPWAGFLARRLDNHGQELLRWLDHHRFDLLL